MALKDILNVFIDHCDSISYGMMDSTPSIHHAILTLVDPYTTVASALANTSLPQSTEPYLLFIDHGIQNGFGDFRFTEYTVDATGVIIEPLHHNYSSLGKYYSQQADKILISVWNKTSKTDVIKLFLEQKGEQISRIQQHAQFLCQHIDLCETCPLHRTSTCPNITELPTANDWVHAFNTLPHLVNTTESK